jgi:hypothetical protein
MPKVTDTMLPTTMIGSYPKPRWFEDYNVGGADLLEWWKIEKHFQAFRDATAACITWRLAETRAVRCVSPRRIVASMP